MEIELKREQIKSYQRVYGGVSAREETVESVVPDTMPDIREILDAEAMISLRSKELENGRVSVTGLLEGTVLYLPEEDDIPRRLQLSSTCSFSMEDASVTEKCRAMVSLQVNAADARALNPRKVMLRLDVSCHAEVYRAGEQSVCCGAEHEAIHTQEKRETLSVVSAVEEKTFVVAEDFSLPTTGSTLRELLEYRTGACVEETKQVGGKLILQGSASLELLYLSEEEKVCRAGFTSAFSQIMDVGENSTAGTVTLMPTAVYVEPAAGSYGAGGVSMELHLTAQVVCGAERELCYLSDAYSNRYPCRAETEPVSIGVPGRQIILRDTVRELADTADGVGEVLCCRVFCGRAELRDGQAELSLNVCVLFLNAQGRLCSMNRRLPCTIPLPAGESVTEAGPVRCSEPYAAPAPGGMELRLPVELELHSVEQRELTAVSLLELENETPLSLADLPSLTVVRRGERSLWELAKRYRSTTELISAANDDMDARFLLIPRAR